MANLPFDAERAFLSREDLFKPLTVTQTVPLHAALARGKVKPETDLLLLNHPTAPLALVKSEMSYHHVAQGEIDGEPWLVSF